MKNYKVRNIQLKRFNLQNHLYFITTTTEDRIRVFSDEENIRILLASMREFLDSCAVKLHAFVILPEHIHLLIAPTTDSFTISHFMKGIKGKSAFEINRCNTNKNNTVENVPMRIWQHQFLDHIVRDDEDYRVHIEYIHNNPVKHNLCKTPEEYKWSSYRCYINNEDILIEDKESMAQMLMQTLEAAGYKVEAAVSAEDGIQKLNNAKIDIVLTDLKLPGKSGMDVLTASKEKNPLTPVIVMTAFGTIETAVKAVKEGAYDFLAKPFDPDHLLLLIERALEKQRLQAENIVLKGELSDKIGLPNIIGKSPKFLEAIDKAKKVAQGKTTKEQPFCCNKLRCNTKGFVGERALWP
ncbi:MAG: response regulator [Nitrospirae bacterium]|nr:response regulator [Nitrospirota bacterium]